MCHRYEALRRRSLSIAAVGLALCLAIPASAKPPSWDKKIDGKGRFKVLKAFDDEAVLDKETGLVWQATPTTAAGWVEAIRACRYAVIGARGGWRLPRYEELATIVDPTSGVLPALHPFALQPEERYFTATTTVAVDGAGSTLFVSMHSSGGFAITNKNNLIERGVWCVRGGSGLHDQ